MSLRRSGIHVRHDFPTGASAEVDQAFRGLWLDASIGRLKCHLINRRFSRGAELNSVVHRLKCGPGARPIFEG
jgi:hypothetical protein